MRISDWSSDVLFRSDLHAIWGGIDLGAAVRTHDLGRRHGRQAEGCRGKEDFDEAELEGHGSLPAVLNGQIRLEKRRTRSPPSPPSDCGPATRSETTHIGTAPWRERRCPYGKTPGVRGPIKKKQRK